MSQNYRNPDHRPDGLETDYTDRTKPGGYDWGHFPEWLKSFRAENDLHHWLLPHVFRETHPLRAMRGVTDAVQSSTMTQKWVTRNRARKLAEYDKTRTNPSIFPPEMFLLHGAFPVNKGTGSATKYANPGYLRPSEFNSVGDRDERIEWLHTYADIGLVGYDAIAPHFGISPGTLNHFSSRHDVGYGERQKEGRYRMWRTWATLNHWGFDTLTISAALGQKYKKVKSAISRITGGTESPAPEFAPPDRPEWSIDEYPDRGEYRTGRDVIEMHGEWQPRSA